MADYVAPQICKPQFDLSTGCTASGTQQEKYVAQVLDISGAPVNVFKLLGVHEQNTQIDLARNGQPIASSSVPGYNISNIFNALNPAGWRSVEQGPAVASSFIGYNFGTKKLATDPARDKYNPPQPITKLITSLKIQQSATQANRAIQLRIERSSDGVKWLTVDVVNVPDVATAEVISFKSTAPTQRWRLVPTLFNGSSTDYWEVLSLELYDSETTDLSNIQDKFLLENRDRAYAQRSIMIKTQYDIQDDQTDLSRFGIQLTNQFRFTASFARIVEKLGRPIVIGDILELPAEVMFDNKLNVVHRWLEVMETGWDPSGYTTNWVPTLLRFTAEPLLAAQETRDLLGWSTDTNSIASEILALNKQPLPMSTLADDASDNLAALAADAVPEKGEDATGITSGLPPVPQDRNPAYDGIGYSVEDGLPPNNLPYTEGPALPVSPADKAYHRVTYELSTGINPRLYQFSAYKNRWIFVEEDKRGVNTAFKPGISRILNSNTSKPLGNL